MDEQEGCAPEGASIVDTLDAGSTFHVFSFLGAKDLMAMAQVCKQWRQHAHDSRHWQRECKELWKSKAYVSAMLRDVALRDARKAYLLSRADALRTHITEQELCSFTWQFKFKHSAGPFWRILVGEMPLQRWFHPPEIPDVGGIMTGPKHDPLWALSQDGDDHYTWVFRDARDGLAGKFVQINQYPSLVPSRTHDWGWHMENEWVEFTALCDGPGNPGRGKEPEHLPHTDHSHYVDAAIGAVNEALAAAVADLEAEEEQQQGEEQDQPL